MIIGLTATACSSSEQEQERTSFSSADIVERGEQFRGEGNDFVADIFEDGEVSESEYLEAIAGFTGCMTAYGYTVSEPILSPMDSLTYTVSADPGGQDVDTYNAAFLECGENWLSEVESMYTATHDAVIDAPLRIALRECLSQKGYETADDARSYTALAGDLWDDADWEFVFQECLGSVARPLYPDVANFVWSR